MNYTVFKIIRNNFSSLVTQYKEKDTIIRKQGNKYYKYKVNFERRPDKSYPVLIQNNFLGTIDARRKMIDIANSIVVSLFDLVNSDDYDAYEIEIIKKIYLILVNEKYYFTKLTAEQKEIIDKHKVGNKNGYFI